MSQVFNAVNNFLPNRDQLHATLAPILITFKRPWATKALPVDICIRQWTVNSSLLYLPGSGHESTQEKAHKKRDMHH